MILPGPHRRPPRAVCQTIRRPPRGGDHQGVNQPSRRPLRGLRSRVIENPGMGDRIQRNTHRGEDLGDEGIVAWRHKRPRVLTLPESRNVKQMLVIEAR